MIAVLTSFQFLVVKFSIYLNRWVFVIKIFNVAGQQSHIRLRRQMIHMKCQTLCILKIKLKENSELCLLLLYLAF